ncbi:MAG: iron-sulfur cluster assembly protein [Alphaproteobacteria bacterium]|nr:iron-sulfur cluster assembly protein [Alphaproteobacteria bacterium]
MSNNKPERPIVTAMQAVADTDMVKNAVGEEYDELAVPPNVELSDHPLVPAITAALKEIYDPEIPVNVYELGLIYKVIVSNNNDVFVEMSLTSPACPVAQEMPGWIQAAILPIDGVGHVDVEVVWNPAWDASMMAETAKLQLNMFT